MRKLRSGDDAVGSRTRSGDNVVATFLLLVVGLGGDWGERWICGLSFESLWALSSLVQFWFIGPYYKITHIYFKNLNIIYFKHF